MGVEIKENSTVRKFIAQGDKVAGVELNTGAVLSADFVIVGIGADPEVSLAIDAGLEANDGIDVDLNCKTSDPDIYAGGDCVNFPYRGQRIRLESVGNAIEQAEIAADSVVGEETRYKSIPWFWSDQFDVKLQIAGLNAEGSYVVQRGKGDKISFWNFKDRELQSVDAINDPLSYMVGKKLIEFGKHPDPKLVADQKFNLKNFIKS